MLARGRRGVGLLGLPPRLGVGDGLRRFHLHAEPGPGGGGGGGVGGRNRLRVGLRGGGRVVVLLVGIRRGLVLAGIRGSRVVLVLRVGGVAHGRLTLRRGWSLVLRLVVFP